jgi:peroxiredoxin (alkyl hydroperoxide reductase subunit C)
MLVTKKAPDFKAMAVMPDNTFQEISLSDFHGKKVVLFFYPLDFTFVCPSEIIAFDHRLPEFEKRGVQVLGCSIDSHFCHWAWKNTPVEQGGIGKVQYPLIADVDKSIARAYEVLVAQDDAGQGGTVALRGTFLIDEKGVIQHATINDLGLGRNIDETLRMVDALTHLQQHGEVCPAGWKEGDEAMKPSSEGVASYLASHSKSL